MITPFFNAAMLEVLEKAVTADVIADLVPEDLMDVAHITQWRASDPNELTLLKLIPSRPTFSIEHKFDQVVKYGETRGYGEMSETSLPLSSRPTFARKSTFIKLIGETTDVYLLASLQKTIKVGGATGADAIAHQLLILNLLSKKNLAYYFMDTSKVRLGADGLRFKGLLQQIREGTDGTSGTSPFGSHVIDMEGQPLNFATLRAKAAKIINLFGKLTSLIMDGYTRADFEATMDGAGRLQLPQGIKPLMFGQHVGGLHTNGSDILFHTDNGLSPLRAQGQYQAVAVEGSTSAPSSVSGSVAAVGGGRTSKWFSADEGEFFWIVTELKNGRESLGRRWPSSGTQPVAAGEEVTLTITPADPLSDGFKVYRGSSGDADTEAYGIFEVANSNGGGAVTAYDDNLYRPNTSFAFGLCIRSESQEALAIGQSGYRSSYSLAAENAEKFLGMPDNPQNTVAAVNLGPAMGTMNLATILPTTSRPLLFSATAIEHRNPLQSIAFINIGSNTLYG